MSPPGQVRASAPFSEWLRRRRQALDLTQQQLAELVGYTSAMLRKVERGERRPSRAMAARLADALAVPAAERDAFLRLARTVEQPDPPPFVQPAPTPVRLPAVAFTRLHPPPLRASRVSRPRLADRIAAPSPGVITIVVAPAGWGKTTAVRAWLAGLDTAAQARVAWLTLDPGDDDPATLLRSVIAAVQRVDERCGAGALGTLEMAHASPDVAVGLLANDLARLPLPLTLILDDVHLLRDRATRRIVELLVAGVPPAIHLILTSREDPPLPLARLRVRGQLIEIRASDLRFTHDEAATLLGNVTGLCLDADAVGTIAQRTEGWAAGLQLAALALRECDDLQGFVREFSGSNRFVLDFLAAEVLDHLAEHMRRLLVRIAILDELCGSLCDTVLRGVVDPAASDSQALLEELERAQLFLVPLDDTRTWFRFHHLFGQVLRAHQAREVSPPELRELHRRAAAWYMSQELWADAFRHACAAEVWELAAAALEHFDEALLLESTARLRSLLALLPRAQRAVRPRLLLLEGLSMLRDQEVAMALPVLARAATLAAEQNNPQVRGEALLHLSDAQRSSGAFAAARATLREALAGPLPAWTRVTALVSQAFEALAAGDWRAAAVPLDAALVLVLASAERRVWLDLAVNIHSPLLVLPGRLPWMKRFVAATLPWPEPPVSALRAAQCWVAGYSLMLQGRLAVAAEPLAEALAINSSLGGAGKLSLDAGLQQTFLLALRGDQPAAEQRIVGLLGALEQPALASYMQVWGALYLYAYGWLRLQQGHDGEARTIAALMAAPGPAEWPTATAARLLLNGLIALGAGELTRAEALLRGAVEQQARFADAFMLGDARLPLALAALRAGRAEVAVATLRVAVDQQAQRGTPGVLLLTGTSISAPLLKLAHAHNIHSALAMQLLKEVGELLEPPAEADRQGMSGRVEALTAREREVLKLLATGASNQAIADTLVISVPTTKTHVARILAKLGATNRTEAIVRAGTEGLLEPA